MSVTSNVQLSCTTIQGTNAAHLKCSGNRGNKAHTHTHTHTQTSDSLLLVLEQTERVKAHLFPCSLVINQKQIYWLFIVVSHPRGEWREELEVRQFLKRWYLTLQWKAQTSPVLQPYRFTHRDDDAVWVSPVILYISSWDHIIMQLRFLHSSPAFRSWLWFQCSRNSLKHGLYYLNTDNNLMQIYGYLCKCQLSKTNCRTEMAT